jgi:hypothetical protein
MKLPSSISRARVQAGYLLLECIVYMAVFVIILGLAMAAFYLCWDNSKALLYVTDDIAVTLHVGEHWRADIRNATGKITIETTTNGERLRIPHGTNELIYSFNAGEVRRKFKSSGFSELLLPPVKASQMVMDTRGPVGVWRWELELKPHRKETHLPLLFTFEAVAKTTP